MNWMPAIGLDSLLARIRTNLNEGAIAAEDRIELARLEWSAQKKRMQTIFVLGIVMGGLTIVALLLISMAVMVQFWDSPQRTVVAWVIACVWFVAWVATLLVLVAVLRKSSRPFELTRAELAKDWSLIKERL